MVTGIIETERGGVTAMQVFFFTLLHAGDIVPEDVLKPCDVFHAALARSRQDGLKHIKRTKIGSTEVFKRRVCVVLRMNRRVASAVECGCVVLLLSMIRQGAAWEPAGRRCRVRT